MVEKAKSERAKTVEWKTSSGRARLSTSGARLDAKGAEGKGGEGKGKGKGKGKGTDDRSRKRVRVFHSAAARDKAQRGAPPDVYVYCCAPSPSVSQLGVRAGEG